MKTVLIPVDFSETSLNAAHYGIALAQDLGVEKVILFHTYGGSYQIMDQGAEVVMATTQALLDNLKMELQKLKVELSHLAKSTLKIESKITAGFLMEDALDIIEEQQVDLVVMGITGKNALEQRLVGTNTYRMATESPCPVLIVPAGATYSKVNHIALSLKFREGIIKETPYQSINYFVNTLGAQLTVMNVADEDYRTVAKEVTEGMRESHLMFDEENANIVFLEKEGEGLVKSLTDYVNENGIQMMIAITHKLGFLRSLFKGSLTKQIAFYTDVPLMVYRAIEKK